MSEEIQPEVTPKRRGRPKGVKNRTKKELRLENKLIAAEERKQEHLKTKLEKAHQETLEARKKAREKVQIANNLARIREEETRKKVHQREQKIKKQRDMVREAARISYLQRVPVLAAIVDAESSTNRDKISAMSELAKVSGLYQFDVTTNGEKIEPSAIMVKFVQTPLVESDFEPEPEEEYIDAEFDVEH